MKTIIFPGNHRQPAEAAYGIVLEDELAHIVVWQVPGKHRGTSLWNTDEGRDNVLNRILETELAGIRNQFVRFSVRRPCACDGLPDPPRHRRLHRPRQSARGA